MLLILAMVAAAAITHAWEQGKTRSAARWADAKARAEERGAQRERDRQRRAAEWESWFDAALSRGPRHALWWGYAAGYLAGGAVAAVGAGVVGAYSGAVAGGRSGYRLGVEAGKAGRRYGDTFRAWRNANRGKSDPIELGICGRCGGWITKGLLVADARHGRVCPDCVPAGTSEPADEPTEDPGFESTVVHDRDIADERPLPPRCANRCGMLASSGSEFCALCRIEAMNRQERAQQRAAQEEAERHKNCRNSDLGPDEAEARGLCPDCAGRGELITGFGGVHKHIPCRRCQGSGGSRRPGAAGEKPRGARCECGRRTDEAGTRCNVCAAQYRAQRNKDEKPSRIYVNAERVDEQEETEPEQATKPKEIENNMTAIEPARSATLDTAGEGYTSTVAGLDGLARLLYAVNQKVNDINDNLTANSLDSETLNMLSDLTDGIETTFEQAVQLHRHVEDRHAPLADATAAAGGSQNVAQKSWYDEY